MTYKPPIPDHVRALPRYVPGRPISSAAREIGLPETQIIKLASNENPRGMSPRAEEALAAFAGEVARYPDPDGFALKAALADRLGVEPDWITLGNGSSEILEIAARAVLAPGRAAVISQYGFIVYRSAVQAVGGMCIAVPAREFGHDLDGMLSAIRSEVDLVYVANPNNPTGTYLEPAAVSRFLDDVPERVVVVLDEAYLEYLDPEERPDSIEWLRRHPNLLVARTFSKAYGLAGLRIGYGIAQPALTEALNRVRPVFNVNVLAQAAALAALGDEDFVEGSRRANREGRIYVERELQARGIRAVPSRGNFLMVHVGDGARITSDLLQRGVIVRPLGNYDLPGWIRVSVGLPDENRTFVRHLAELLEIPRSDEVAKPV